MPTDIKYRQTGEFAEISILFENWNAILSMLLNENIFNQFGAHYAHAFVAWSHIEYVSNSLFLYLLLVTLVSVTVSLSASLKGHFGICIGYWLRPASVDHYCQHLTLQHSILTPCALVQTLAKMQVKKVLRCILIMQGIYFLSPLSLLTHGITCMQWRGIKLRLFWPSSLSRVSAPKLTTTSPRSQKLEALSWTVGRQPRSTPASTTASQLPPAIQSTMILSQEAAFCAPGRWRLPSQTWKCGWIKVSRVSVIDSEHISALYIVGLVSK